jgi:hypothetical protein
MKPKSKSPPKASQKNAAGAIPVISRPRAPPTRPSATVAALRLNPPQTLSVIPPATKPMPQAELIQPSCIAPPPKCLVTSSGISDMAGQISALRRALPNSSKRAPGQCQR